MVEGAVRGDEEVKVRIEVDDTVTEDEVVIRCREINGTIQKIQQSVLQETQKVNLVFYQGNTEYYLPLQTILFFETSQNGIDAHTADNVFQVRSKLYELEDLLPANFIRISKSTIANTDQIYSIDRSLASSSRIQFRQTHKQVYVSRNYYKSLKNRLEERRNYHA